MSERFEGELDAPLIGLLARHLAATLKAAGFAEYLRLAESHLSEYRRGEAVVSVVIEHVAHERQRLVVESEAVDVQPLVGEAARRSLLDVTTGLLAALPWVDRAALEHDLDAVLRPGLRPE
ncbi:MAG: hypothetical protein ACYC3S_11880 [Chloroflexota bacterium]